MLRPLVARFVSARDDELTPVLWATAYGFCILFSYYILRAVRDEISSADRGNLQILWTAVFVVMLLAVPLYSWVASRYPRGVFVPLANRFFIANLVLFYVALTLLPPALRPWIDRAFYVWASVFALFVVTVFWGFMADCFRNEQGKRLFGFIAVGSSLGGIAGSAVTASLVEVAPAFTLLLVACVPLELASWCAAVLHRRFGGGADATRVENQPLGGSAWSGIGVIFRSPYLLGIAAYIALMTFASTVLYFQQAHLVGEAVTDRAARTALFARIDLWANALTILLQTYLTARIIRAIGIAASLLLLPAALSLGFLGLGAYPLLVVLIGLQVFYRSVRYGLAKPAREVLFTVVSREEKYKSKAFLDAAVYRGGDLVSGWLYAGLAALGLSVGAIAFVAAPVAVVWAVVGFRLGTAQERRARAGTPGTPESPTPASS
ncbi:MAG: MFS transporter [Gemmatimonadota bacterium]|nr:MFS transporter [Gemmatimonadota bacterium]